jgi:hypothetical protein
MHTHTHTQADECAGAMPSLVDRLCQVWFVLVIITGVILFRIGTALVQAVKPITGQSNAEASHSCTVWGCASIPPRTMHIPHPQRACARPHPHPHPIRARSLHSMSCHSAWPAVCQPCACPWHVDFAGRSHSYACMLWVEKECSGVQLLLQDEGVQLPKLSSPARAAHSVLASSSSIPCMSLA